jgi:response regulator RpfG family c-di-GMP phosphodiesterase
MNPIVLLVDDSRENLYLLERVLRTLDAGMEILAFASAEEALAWCRSNEPDLVLADYRMPGMDGLALLEALRRLPGYGSVPIVLMSAEPRAEIVQRALLAGATDFLARPVAVEALRAQLAPLLVSRLALADPRRRLARLVRSVERALQASVEDSHAQLLRKLAPLARCGDGETAAHMQRVARVAQRLAARLGLGSAFCDTIWFAAPLHDLGKAGIPARILHKPGRLTPEEWEIMKDHTLIGYEALKGARSPVLKMAAVIAYTHHERYDGSGYPRGLAGEAIPIEGRIVAVADQLDALLSARAYKPSWRVEHAVEWIRRLRGTHFDPDCVDALVADLDAVLAVRREYESPTPVGAANA